MLIAFILLIFSLLIGVSTLLFVKWLSRRHNQIAIISPDSTRKHLAVVCFVRGVELLLGVAMLGLLMLIFWGALVSLDPWRAHPGLSKAYVITVMIAVPLLLVTMVIVLPAWRRHWNWEGGFFRNVLRVDSNSVSTFAFVFAALAAHDFYQLWPYRNSAPHNPYPFPNRELLWLFVFFGLGNGIRNLLFRILEMRRKEPPADPEPPDSGSFVPFNP